MSDSKRLCTRLFNNPSLSDVKLKQTYKGQTREYYAHKAILCQESDYFLNAFTGNFKESSEAIMELHEDDPEHFELLLKYIYTGAYSKDEIAKLAGDDKSKRVLIPIGIHAIADKYDVAKLNEPTAEDVKAVLLEAVKDQVMIVDAIRAYYSTQVNADGSMGRLITSVIFEKYGDFVHTEEFERLLLANPTFATDVALHYQRNKVLRVAGRAQCQSCKLQAVDIGIMRTRGMVSFHCPLCMLKQSLPAHGKN